MADTEPGAMWLWEPTLLLRWRVAGSASTAALLVDAEMLRVRGTTLVLEQLWRGRQVDDGVVDPRHPTKLRVPYEMREEWREVPVVEGEGQ